MRTGRTTEQTSLIRSDIERVRLNDPTLTEFAAVLDWDDLMELCNALRGNTNLSKLDLSYSMIREDHAIIIAEVLRTNTTLHTLSLRGGIKSIAAAKAIAEAIGVNKGLCSLDLAANSIGRRPQFIEALAQALRVNTTLRTLTLIHNNIDDDAAATLADALWDNKTLTLLHIGANPIAWHIVDLIHSLLARNKVTKWFLDAADNTLVVLFLLDKLKTECPDIDDPVAPQPAELAKIYREYNTLDPLGLSLAAVISLLSRSDPYPNSIQLEVNKTLALYIFPLILSFPELIKKNSFRMILWLLRDHLNDEDLEEIITISAIGAVDALDDTARLRFAPKSRTISIDELLTPAEVKGIEDDKQIIIEQLISMQAPEAQSLFQFDALVNQVTALNHRLENKSLVNVLENELKMRFSSTPEGIAYRFHKELSEYLALPRSSKYTNKELARLESILTSRLLFDERSQFHNGDNKYVSEITELKAALATMDKMADLASNQLRLEWAQKLLVQQVSDLSKCTEGRLCIELRDYLAMPDHSLFSEEELTWLEAAMSRRRDELSLQARDKDDSSACAYVELTTEVEQEHDLLAEQMSKLLPKWHTDYRLLVINLKAAATDQQLRELAIELENALRHCRGLQLSGHFVALDYVDNGNDQYIELVTSLKKVVQDYRSLLNGDLTLLNEIDGILDQLAGQIKNKHNELGGLLITLEARLHLLAELEEELSCRRLRDEFSYRVLSPGSQFTHGYLAELEAALSRRRHDVVSRRHHRDDQFASKIREFNELTTAMTTIANINKNKSKTNLDLDLAGAKERARCANEVEGLTTVPETIALIRRRQAKVQLNQECGLLTKQITALSQCTKRGKSEFSLTIFTSSVKTSVEGMRKIFDAYLAKEPSEQIAAAVLGQLIQDLQVRLEYVSAPSRMQHHEAEIALLGQVIETIKRITMIQSPVMPVVSAASAAAEPVSASLAPRRV